MRSLATVFFLAATAFAGQPKYDDFRPIQPAELSMKSEPAAPGAHAVLLDFADIDDDNNNTETVYYRIKVLTEEGKKEGDVEIPFLRGGIDIHNIKARTIRPDGSVVPFTGQIFTKTVAKTRHVSYQAKTFSFPEVQPGSILEYTYKMSWDPQALYNTQWVVQHNLYTRHEYFSITPYDGRVSYYNAIRLPEGAKIVRKNPIIEMELTNVPAFEAEEYAPPEKELKPRVDFYYAGIDVETPEKFWKRVGKETNEYAENFINHSKNTQALVATLVSPNDQPEDKLRELYARAQKVRNLSYEDEKSQQELKRANIKDLKNVDDVLNRGYGSRREINRLFVAMARAAGFNAGVVLVSQRDETFFNMKLLSLYQMDSEVAVVDLNGKPKYLDPGTPFCPFGLLAWENTGVHGIRLDKQGGEFVVTPQFSAAEAVTKRWADLKWEDGILKGKVRLTFSGLEGLSQKLRTLRTDDKGFKDYLKAEAQKLLPENANVTVTSIDGLQDSEKPLVAEYDVTIGNVGSAVGSKLLLSPAIFESRNHNPFEHEQRRHMVYFDYSFAEQDDVNITFPSDYTIQAVPEQKLDKRNFGLYQSFSQPTGNKLRFQRLLGLTTFVVPLNVYPEIRTFYSNAITGDQENVIVKRTAVTAQK